MPRTAPNVVVKASQLSSAARCCEFSSSWNTVRMSLASCDVIAISEPYRPVSAAPDRPGSGGLGDQVAGQTAVIVAAAGGDQAEIAGEGEQAGLLGLGLVRVEDLHPGQAGGG